MKISGASQLLIVMEASGSKVKLVLVPSHRKRSRRSSMKTNDDDESNNSPTGFQRISERDDFLEVLRNVQTLSISNILLEFGDYAMETGCYWNLVAREKFDKSQTEFPQLKLLKNSDESFRVQNEASLVSSNRKRFRRNSIKPNGDDESNNNSTSVFSKYSRKGSIFPSFKAYKVRKIRSFCQIRHVYHEIKCEISLAGVTSHMHTPDHKYDPKPACTTSHLQTTQCRCGPWIAGAVAPIDLFEDMIGSGNVPTSSGYYDGFHGAGVLMVSLRFISGSVFCVDIRGRVYVR
ncbi:hypothetical protein RND71_001952 [Anisodus tanguticus]|uniref:Uncharacterized protein n=1 Tax=Anisodus tanguticus TaxID=243964 RepID=A0AAE1T278_9SOLA|nr:hypothetical protein RND71_001952 [Anisodus tanguticus]